MRPLLHADVTSAARALLMVPEMARWGLCRRMLNEAELAFAHVRRTGRAHADWGDGSLMASARRRPLAPEPFLDDLGYCSCLEMVLQALMARGGGAGVR